MGDTWRVRLGVLGPLELFVDDAEVPITRLQVRRLLSILAACTDLYTSSDALVEGLWADHLPADPRAALSVVMSRTRVCLGSSRGCLESGDKGHRLDVHTDLAEFEQLLAAARAATEPRHTIDLIDRALALWRGHPFPDVADVDLVGPVITRIEEARWNALTMLVESLVGTGQHGRAIAVAAPLHGEQPQRERLSAALARSLAFEGRKSDALAVLRTTAHWLRDQLGLDASALITDLESEILHGAVELVPSRSTATFQRVSAFVGREAEVERLTTMRPGLRVVVGEPGIGKTSLLRHVAAVHESRGIQAIAASASPTPERPMDSVVEIVEQLLERRPLEPHELVMRAALARIVPTVDAPEHELEALSRDVLIDSVVEFIERSSPPDEVVLLIDDCQWLDQGSASVIERLADGGRCNVLAGLRPEFARDANFLTAPDAATVEVINLAPLTASEVDALAERELSSESAVRRASDVWRRSGGNPLFALLLIELIGDGAGVSADLPATVLIAVQQRLQALSTRARATLQTAAVIGSRFSMPVLRQLCATADVDVDEAVAARLIDVDEANERASFVHSLVADGAYQLIADGRRVMLHDEVGRLLENVGAAAAEYARHYGEAATLDPRRAAVAHHDAARIAAAAYSWDLVEQHALAGLGHLGARRDLLEARLAVLLGASQRLMHRDQSDDALIRGAVLARELGEHELFADAVVALSVQNWSTSGAISETAVGLLEEAMQLDLPKTQRAQICAAGSTFAMTGRHEQARAMYHEALEIALTLDDPTVQAEILRYSRWGLIHPDDLGMLGEATILLSDLAGHDIDLRWGAATNRYAIGTINADLGMVERALAGLRAIHKTLGPSPRDWEMTHLEAGHSILVGALDDAEEWLDRTWAIGRENASPEWLIPVYGAGMIALRRAQQRLADLTPFVDSGIAAAPGFLAWRAAAAACAAAAGDRRRAEFELALVSANSFGDLIPDATWSAVVMLATDAIEFLGDVDRAAQLEAMVSPYSGRMTWSGVATMGPIDDALCRLNTVVGNDVAAQRHQRQADVLFARLNSRR